MAVHQAPPSLGFSRQEHWSGLPFPSPMHESEVDQSCPTLSNPMDCSLPGSSVHGIFQARVLEWGAIVFSMTNLDSILKSRDITLPTKVRLVKAMVFPVVTYGCESWTIKKAAAAAAADKSHQSCPTLCGPIDSSPSGSPVPGILQARILEWVAVSFSNG